MFWLFVNSENVIIYFIILFYFIYYFTVGEATQDCVNIYLNFLYLYFIIELYYFFGFGGHTWQCTGLAPGSVFRYHSFQVQVSIWDVGDLTYVGHASALPLNLLSLWALDYYLYGTSTLLLPSPFFLFPPPINHLLANFCSVVEVKGFIIECILLFFLLLYIPQINEFILNFLSFLTYFIQHAHF